ncbi:hypothetical protein NliqN6_3708 [Naganishia liquefaciens]|uniref:FCP1 homology domain-containing protein n=1 Tax=Naganishia liquefaciens TaxID=104408 RepID=A0A8H3TUR8_9TREE|nr:hypothetical protein NliqN6_3708 [Naganishia liquefaciens]
MNSLSTLDRYLLDRWNSSAGNPRTTSSRWKPPAPGPAASNSGSPSSRRRSQIIVPDSVLASTEPVLPPGQEPGKSLPVRARPTRRPTGYPGAHATDTASSSTSTAPLDSSGPDPRRRRRKRPLGQGRRGPLRNRNPNAEEGWMTAGFVGVLGLWSDLWTAIFGPDEEDWSNARNDRLAVKHDGRLEGKRREDEVSASSASETETEDKTPRSRRRDERRSDGQVDGSWVDPVTRAPDDPGELLRQAAEAEMLSSNGAAVAGPDRASSSSSSSTRRTSPQLVSFQLGKKTVDPAESARASSATDHPASMSSILTNSTTPPRHTLPTLLPTIQSTHASASTNNNILIETRRQPPADGVSPPLPRNTKLLPAPLSVPLSAPTISKRRNHPTSRSAAAAAAAAHQHATQHQPSLSITAIPRALSTTPFHRPKTLILDLDETLIHSTSRPLSLQSSGMGSGSGIMGISLSGLFSGGKHQRGGGGARGEGHVVEVVLGGRSTLYHVYKRPYVDHFLKKVSSWYTLVIFTASMQEYADPVIDWLDGGRGYFAKKLYRESCALQPNGSYTKDLSLVEQDLSRVCFMDNSPVSYNWNKANALPIEGWTSDPNDEALLDALPVLDSLRFTSDVRKVLGIRGF